MKAAGLRISWVHISRFGAVLSSCRTSRPSIKLTQRRLRSSSAVGAGSTRRTVLVCSRAPLRTVWRVAGQAASLRGPAVLGSNGRCAAGARSKAGTTAWERPLRSGLGRFRRCGQASASRCRRKAGLASIIRLDTCWCVRPFPARVSRRQAQLCTSMA